jgi:hypothetical protein
MAIPNGGLGSVEPVLPTNETTLCASDLSFSWNAVDGADSYLPEVTESSSGNKVISETVTSTTYTPLSTLALDEYTWSVSALIDGISVGTSDTWSFTLSSPEAPNISSPADGQTFCAPDDIVFNWTNVPWSVSDGSSVGYNYEILDSGSSVINSDYTSNNTMTYTFPGNDTYTFRIQTVDDGCKSVWNEIEVIIDDSAGPSPAENLEISGDLCGDPTDITFNWTGGIADLEIDSVITDTDVTPPVTKSMSPGSHTWRVIIRGTGSCSGQEASADGPAFEINNADPLGEVSACDMFNAADGVSPYDALVSWNDLGTN